MSDITLRVFVFSAVMMVGVLIAGSLLYGSMASNYGVPVPSSMTEIQGTANTSMQNLYVEANSSMQTIKSFQSGDILGVVTGALSLPGMLWGVAKFVFDVPNMIMTLIAGEETSQLFPGMDLLFIIIFTAFFLYIAFKFVEIIFKSG